MCRTNTRIVQIHVWSAMRTELQHSGVKHPGFSGHNPDMRWIPPNLGHSYTFTILQGTSYYSYTQSTLSVAFSLAPKLASHFNKICSTYFKFSKWCSSIKETQLFGEILQDTRKRMVEDAATFKACQVKFVLVRFSDCQISRPVLLLPVDPSFSSCLSLALYFHIVPFHQILQLSTHLKAL